MAAAASVPRLADKFRDHTWIPRFAGEYVRGIAQGVFLADATFSLRADTRVGQGTYGEVWLCTDDKTNLCALKRFFPDPENPDWAYENALKEKRAIDHLGPEHPHVPRLVAVGSVLGDPALCFEGFSNLASDPKSLPLSMSHLREMILCVTVALAEAHRKGLVHGDVKPANILRVPGRLRAMLLDWGTAFISPGRLDAPEDSLEFRLEDVYSPHYRPPEVIVGAHYGPEGDMWALGVTLFVMATGLHPWPKAKEKDLTLAILHQLEKWSDLCLTSEDLDANPDMRRDCFKGKALQPVECATFSCLPAESLYSVLARDGDSKTVANCIDFFNCLKTHWKVRMTAEQALRHPFLLGSLKLTLRLPPDWAGGTVYVKGDCKRFATLDHPGHVSLEFFGPEGSKALLCNGKEEVVRELEWSTGDVPKGRVGS